MLAAAILVAIAATDARTPDQPGLAPLSVIEVRRLFTTLITHANRPANYYLAWSRWRRIHQARARTSHYRTRGDSEHQPSST